MRLGRETRLQMVFEKPVVLEVHRAE